VNELPTPWVTPDELAAHLLGSAAPWCILDARFDLSDPTAGARSFALGHLSGAHYLHLDHDLSRPRSPAEGRHPLPERAVAAQRFAALGVTQEQPVVVMDAGNALFAARAWWMLRELGHPTVRVLAGGLAAWQAAGFPLTTVDTPAPAVSLPWALDTPPAGFGTVEADAVWAAVQQGACLLDARAPERFSGLSEPLDPVAGHIPGARNLPYSSLLQADGTLLPIDQLRARLLAALAGSPPEEALLMCGSGVTACALQLAFAAAGLSKTRGPRVYVGSWSEWSRQTHRPVATGPT
jgi:thiosulfate/3-mercaptopyruvate sulfurtransferase